eukprot:14328533-Ditylum_brightwellii.AAC.1
MRSTPEICKTLLDSIQVMDQMPMTGRTREQLLVNDFNPLFKIVGVLEGAQWHHCVVYPDYLSCRAP